MRFFFYWLTEGQQSTPSSHSTNDTEEPCHCVSCREKLLEKKVWEITKWNAPTQCLECNSLVARWNWSTHYQQHFKTENGKYPCTILDCKKVASRWADLKRHAKSQHCVHAERFPCDVWSCKYGGDNGFLRRDKLLSHKRNVHDGKAAPNQPMRKLMPKPAQTDAQAGPSS